MDRDLPEGSDYALEIEQGEENNFAGPFAVVDSEPESTSSGETLTTTLQAPRETKSQRSTEISSTRDLTRTTDGRSSSESSQTQPTLSADKTSPTTIDQLTLTSSEPTSREQSNTLGTVAIAGISVGAGIVGLLLGIGIILLLLHLREKRKQNGLVPAEASHPDLPEMEDQDRSLVGKKWFLRGRWRSEVGVEEVERRHELDGKNVNAIGGPRAELYGEAGC